MKNLEQFGLQELDNQELRKIKGGFWRAVGSALLVYGIVSAIEHPDAFMDGLLGK